MATVTAFTASRSKEIEDSAITGARLEGTDLILIPRGFATQPLLYPELNVGNIQGIQGIQGPMGEITAAQMNAAIAAAHADGMITNAQLASNAVTSVKIQDGSVGTTKLADLSVTQVKIGNSAVGPNQIQNDAVNGSKIANDSINSEHYVDGSIDNAHLAAGSVTNIKLGNDAVNAAKIADDSINSEHYVNGSIDNAHVAANAISASKLSKFSWANDLSGDQDLNGFNDVSYLTSNTFSAPAGSLLFITASWDFKCVVVGSPIVACVGKLRVGGTFLADHAIFVPSHSGQRATVSKSIVMVTPNYGTPNISLWATKTGGFGEYKLGNTHTTLRVVCIPA